MTIEILYVAKMRSRRDRWAITAALEGLPGVRAVLANQADRTVRVERDETASLAAILRAVQDAGYDVAVLA